MSKLTYQAVQDHLASLVPPREKEMRESVVHHTVWDEELSKRASRHLTALGFADIIQYHDAEAVETLRQTDGPFDIIFNDIDKQAYPASLDIIKEKLRRRSCLLKLRRIWSH